MGYSVAIRTLGTSPETLKQELISLHRQTVLPEKIIIYIAKGYPRPDFRVGIEEYVEVKKGMVSQRALDYNEIDSEYILLLDDDVKFDDRSLERILKIANKEVADCVAFDTFKNHEMSTGTKIKSAVTNWVLPRYNSKWAFKIHSHGSFSYINNPQKEFYPSMSAGGPASLWRRASLLSLKLKDEVWLDKLSFAYGEDNLGFYKLYKNGGKLLVFFDGKIENLDAKSSSQSYLNDPERFRVRAKAMVILWHRMIYSSSDNIRKAQIAKGLFNLRLVWTFLLLLLMSFSSSYRNHFKEFYRGIKEGKKFVKSKEYQAIPPYIFYENTPCHNFS